MYIKNLTKHIIFSNTLDGINNVNKADSTFQSISKLVRSLFLLFVLLSAIFGNNFLKKYLIEGIIYPLEVLTFVAFFYCIIYIDRLHLIIKKNSLLPFGLIVFHFLLSISIIWLSYLGIYKDYLQVSDQILFTSTIIPRQSYFIIEGPILFLAGILAFNGQKIKSSYSFILIFICLSLFHLFGIAKFRTWYIFFPIIGIFYGKSTRVKYFSFFCLFSSYILLKSYGTGAYLVLTGVLFASLFPFFSLSYLKNNLLLILFSILFIILSAMFFSVDIIKKIDGNSWWRLLFWKDNILTAFKSNLLGVGYGTSYSSSDLAKEILMLDDRCVEYGKRYCQLIIAQHNSVINLFYRQGLLGFSLFFIYISMFLKSSIKIMFFSRDKLYSIYPFFLFFCSSFFLIFVNVGFESPQYFIFFIFSCILLYSILGLEDSKV